VQIAGNSALSSDIIYKILNKIRKLEKNDGQYNN
jgi:Kef-type K+ transport system membrane component KefB